MMLIDHPEEYIHQDISLLGKHYYQKRKESLHSKQLNNLVHYFVILVSIYYDH